jgi:hypothetical protein
MQIIGGRFRAMHIPLPNGDKLVPDAEFLEAAGGVTPRTGSNWDEEGCPHTYIGGKKYRLWKAWRGLHRESVAAIRAAPLLPPENPQPKKRSPRVPGLTEDAKGLTLSLGGLHVI